MKQTNERRSEEVEVWKWTPFGPARRRSDLVASFCFGLILIGVGRWVWEIVSAAVSSLWTSGMAGLGQWWAELGQSIGQWLGGAL